MKTTDDLLDLAQELRDQALAAGDWETLALCDVALGTYSGPALLRWGADTTHETAEEWWGGLGYHVDVEGVGSIAHPWCDWVDLDLADDDAVIAAVASREDLDLSEDEDGAAHTLVDYARRARDAAEHIAAALDRAVAAYRRDDSQGVVDALREAGSAEIDYGDDPATSSLRDALIIASADDGYRCDLTPQEAMADVAELLDECRGAMQ